jgi:uncharacterized membrane protein YphA (DoxX/SURF4 family)
MLIGARLGLGVALLWAGLSKFREPFDFLNNVYAYELTGPRLGLLVAVVLPTFEVVTAICLLSGLFVGGALAAATLAGGVFVIAQALALHRGRFITCGCFGAGSDGVVGSGTLLRASLLLATALLGLVSYRVRQKVLNRQRREQETGVGAATPPERMGMLQTGGLPNG